jgi:hypothetical protein
MTLNPQDDVLAQVIASYQGYAETLDGEKSKHFQEMLNLCYQYVGAINAKGEPFPEEAVIMTLLLKQHIIIEELKEAQEQLKRGK